MTNLKYVLQVVLFFSLFHTGNTLADNKPTAPPWSAKKIASKHVSEVYYWQWYRAENQQKCGLIVLTTAKNESTAKPRKANFSGGWAVAYDKPNQRSSFGIAGTGVLALDSNDSKAFPNLVRWSDGSYVSYGLEGGTGPGYLAYVTVAGQACLYNVWSKQGKKHLEQLIIGMRFAEKAGK